MKWPEFIHFIMPNNNVMRNWNSDNPLLRYDTKSAPLYATYPTVVWVADIESDSDSQNWK